MRPRYGTFQEAGKALSGIDLTPSDGGCYTDAHAFDPAWLEDGDRERTIRCRCGETTLTLHADART